MIKPFEKMSLTEQSDYLEKQDAGTHPDLVFEFTEEQEREMALNRILCDKLMKKDVEELLMN